VADLRDPDVLAAAVERVLDDPALAAALAAAGPRRAAGFTWSRAADGTLAAYRRALGAG